LSSWHSKVFSLGEKCIDVIESAVVVLLIVLAALALVFTVRDLALLKPESTISEVQVLVNDVFLVIIFAEILRSVLAARKRGEVAYILVLAEVGFVVVLREILVSVVTRTPIDVLISVVALMVMSITIYVLKVKVGYT